MNNIVRYILVVHILFKYYKICTKLRDSWIKLLLLRHFGRSELNEWAINNTPLWRYAFKFSAHGPGSSIQAPTGPR